MLLGPPMPAPYSDWRFVERDLYDTARQVREYDKDAAIVRHRDGQLGLARYAKASEHISKDGWLFASVLHDPDTFAPLTGEPDGRVLRCQRLLDGWRMQTRHDWRRHRRRIQENDWRKEAREHARIEDEEGVKAEEYVHHLARDLSAHPRTFVPKKIGAAA